MMIEIVVGAVVFALGFLAGRYLSRQDDSRADELAKELELSRREVGVVINILEGVGIRFNRDHDRNVTGLVVDVQAELHGVAEMGG
jgi:hypothetical protein